jgi:AraC-like DNA-binding protein
LTKGEPATGLASAWITERFRTCDPDELAEYLNRYYDIVTRKIVPLGRNAEFRLCRNEMHLGRVRLAQTTNTSHRYYARAQPSSILSVVVSERGQSLLSCRNTEIVSDCGNAAIAAGAGEGFFESPTANTRFIVQLSRSEFLQQLQAPGGSRTKPLEAWTKVDLSSDVGRKFHRAVNFIWHQQAPVNEMLRTAYDEILLHGLVSLFGPPMLGEAPATPPDPGSTHVRRACELIRARVAEPIRIAEIARELGISPRHLQSGFRRHLGTTPHEFLRDCRLDMAHRLLVTSLPGQTITSVAYDCGFGHLGEFAQNYRSRFGESPSETLRRRRAIDNFAPA